MPLIPFCTLHNVAYHKNESWNCMHICMHVSYKEYITQISTSKSLTYDNEIECSTIEMVAN